MKSLFATTILLFSFPVQAMEFSVVGRGGQELYRAQEAFSVPAKVGDVTVFFLERSGLDYKGDKSGIAAIAGLDTRMEQVSRDEVRAYGWCYSVNGFAPEEMPDQVEIHDPDTKIRWFYGFARAIRGEWVSQCEPAALP